MARSLKKGPFADESLLKKVDAMNAAEIKQLLRPGHVVLQSSLHSLDTQLLSMTEENMCRYMLQKIWLDINSESLLQPEHTEDTAKTGKNQVYANILEGDFYHG